MKIDRILSPGLLASTLRRYWPLWLAGFVGLVLLFDVPLYNAAASITHETLSSAERIGLMEGFLGLLNIGSWFYALIAGAVVALALNEHLFDERAATFVGALPLRRPVTYVTLALAGLLMLLAIPALAALLLVPLRFSFGSIVTLGSIARWYLLTALLTIVFYACAMLSCQLAGTRPVALLLYLVICFLAFCLEWAARFALSALIYGMSSANSLFDWLAPGIWMGRTALLWNERQAVAPVSLACYVAAAVLMLVLAGVLYQRRNLETAGDSVSVASLRPVLKYLAGISMALLFSSVFRLTREGAIDGYPMGPSEAATMAILMVVGGFLGILFAEMIMRRSTHVFSWCWRGALVLAAASVAFVGICWFDVLGVGRYVPDVQEVESVELSGIASDRFALATPEGVAGACDLHREVLSNGGEGIRDESVCTLYLTYHLKSGRVVNRTYPIAVKDMYAYDSIAEAPQSEGKELVMQYAELADSPEGRASRYAEVLAEDKQELTLLVEYRTEGNSEDDGGYASLTLSDAEKADFIENALAIDLMEEAAGEVLSSGMWTSDGFDATLEVQKTHKSTVDESAFTAGEIESGTIGPVLCMQLDESRCPHVIDWIRAHHPEITLMAWGE